MTAAAIAWRGVSKTYGRGHNQVTALAGVDLQVRPGEMVTILGPSGCGKSTLVHLGVGLDRPTTGTVEIGGVDLGGLGAVKLAELRRRQVGVVFQRLNLVPALTAIENVALPLELDGIGRRTALAAGERALESVGLPDAAGRFPDDLSGGEQQRVAVARAIVGGRGLILADEPTGALDSATADAIVELLARLAAAGTAVLLVTHDARFASWSDRVVIMRDGAVVDETVPAGARR